MIAGIRRRFTHSIDDPWNADSELQPEVEEAPDIPTDTALLLAATKMTAESASNDVDMREYYKSLVQTAIQHDGNYQGQQMSVPWLRMILAGFEFRPFAPEKMWQGEEANGPRPFLAEIPSYEDLFPSEKTATTGTDRR
jgi:hypothetical protein